jgi:small-conductance mechanosensitive channel
MLETNRLPNASVLRVSIRRNLHPAALLVVASLVVCLPITSASAPSEADKAAAEVAKKPELFKLKNDDLLKQADAVVARASEDYKAQLRNLATTELSLQDINSQAEAIKPPTDVAKPVSAGDLTGSARGPATATTKAATTNPAPSKPATDKVDSVKKISLMDAAKAAVDAAKATQDLAAQKKKLVLAKKAQLDRLSSGFDACNLTAVAFQNALDDLSAYSVEVGLRVKDGSLPSSKVPDALKPDVIQKKKKELLDDQAKRKERRAAVQQEEAAVTKQIEDANEAVFVAEADLSLASKKLAQDQKKQEMEKAIAARQPADLLEELTRMVDEGHGLKGNFELNLRRFHALDADFDSLRKVLDDLKQPEVKAGQVTQTEGPGQTAKSTQELVGFYEKRAKLIEALQAAFGMLIKQGGDFETEAAVFGDHLLKLQVIASVLQQTDAKLPPNFDPETLPKAAKAVGESTAGVLAAMEGAKSESRSLAKQLVDARSAGEAASAQLANLKKSQSLTVSSVEYDTQLKAMDGPQAVAAFSKDEKALKEKQAELDAARGEFNKAAAAAAEAKAKLDAVKDSFFLSAEDAERAEKQKINGELRKEAGLEREVAQTAVTAVVPEPAQPTAKKAEADKPADAGKDKPEPTPLASLGKTSKDLSAFQQTVASLVDVLDIREGQKKVLIAAVAAAEQKATVYAKALTEARRLVLQLSTTAIDLKRRVGRGELQGDTVPEGITQALQRDLANRLDADNAALLDAQAQLQTEGAALAKADPTAEAVKTQTREILTLVGQRLDLLGDLKGLDADYVRPTADRPPSQAKQMKQKAADLKAQGSSGWDVFIGVGASDSTKNLSEILDAQYEELIEITGKEDNLHAREQKVDRLIDLTSKESAAIAKMLPLLGEQITGIEAKKEEGMTLAMARLNPERADELLKNFMTKTGRLLGRPVPVADKQKAQAVNELTDSLFEDHVQLAAVGKWRALLDGRRGPSGLGSESGLYQQVQGELKAMSAANSRRVQALAGNPLPAPTKPADLTSPSPTASEAAEPPALSVTGGEIVKTRADVRKLQTKESLSLAFKILGILLAAFLLPKILGWVLALRRRPQDDAGNFDMVVTTLKAIFTFAVWVAACVSILTLLGFEVSAIIAGLGLFGIGVAFAAQPTFTDIISAFLIFIERRYKTGDVISLDGSEPSKVVGMTWRVTQLKNANGIVVNIPNQVITRSNLQNMTREGKTYDSINVTVSTTRDVEKVQDVIREAMSECKYLSTDRGESVNEFNHKGESKVIKYRFWWYLRDYEMRNKTRDEVFTRISRNLAAEHLAGTEVTLS